MITATRKQTPAQARKAALESDYTPFYAVAGLTQTVASTLQATTTRAGEQLAAWQDRNERQAKSTAEDLTKLVRTLPEQVLALPETTKARIAELQKQAAEIVGAANSAYVELAGRGKLVVDETIGSARKLGGSAERRAGDVLSNAGDLVDPAFEKAQEGVTQARRNVSGRSATETLTPRSAQKASVTRARKTSTKSPGDTAGTKGAAKATDKATDKATAKATDKRATAKRATATKSTPRKSTTVRKTPTADGTAANTARKSTAKQTDAG